MTATNRLPRQALGAISALALAFSLSACDAFMSPEHRIERAQQAMAKGDYRAASVDLRTALQAEGDNAAARLLMAQVAMKLDDPLAAQTELRKARELGVTGHDAAVLEADVLLALGKFAALIEAVESGKIKLDAPTRLTGLGRAYNGLGEHAKAIDAFQSALKQAPESAVARAGMAEALSGTGDNQRALATVSELTREQPSFAYGWLVQGRLQGRAGEFKAAADSLRMAEKQADGLDAYQTITMLGLGIEANLAHGDRAEASRMQKRLVASRLNPPLAALLGARILLAEHKYPAAIDLLQPLVSTAPDFVPARFLLGAALLADDRLEQAEHQLSRVVREHPEHIEARKLLAQARLRLSRGSAAIEALMPALEADENDASLAGLAAAANLQAGNRKQAIDILERAVAENLQDVDAQLRLTRALLMDQQFARAASVLQHMPAVARSHPQRAAMLISAVALKDGTAAADKVITTLLQDTQNDPVIMNVVAAHYARRAEYERAKTYLAQALQAAPNDVETQLHMAKLQEATGNAEVARGMLERLLTHDNGNVSAALELARLSAQQGDNAKAARILERGLNRTPKQRALQLALIQQYFASKQPARAEQLAGQMLAAEPRSAQLNNALGQLYSDVNAYDQALARFTAAAAAEPENLRYQFAVARTRLALGQPEAARVMLSQILQRRPQWTPAVATIALMDLRDGKTDVALSRAKDHVAEHVQEPAPLVLLGDVQLWMRRYADAAQSYARAASLRDSATIALKEARARQLGALDEVEAPLLRWLNRAPGDLMVHNVLAEVYSSTGRPARAIAEYELLVAQRPKDAMALNNLAWLYFQSGDPRALNAAERAYRMAPEVAGVADTYGWILTTQGRASEALDILRKADVGSGGQFEIGYHYAVALTKAGQTAAARERLGTLLKSAHASPDRSAAEQLLARLQGH